MTVASSPVRWPCSTRSSAAGKWLGVSTLNAGDPVTLVYTPTVAQAQVSGITALLPRCEQLSSERHRGYRGDGDTGSPSPTILPVGSRSGADSRCGPSRSATRSATASAGRCSGRWTSCCRRGSRSSLVSARSLQGARRSLQRAQPHELRHAQRQHQLECLRDDHQHVRSQDYPVRFQGKFLVFTDVNHGGTEDTETHFSKMPVLLSGTGV